MADGEDGAAVPGVVAPPRHLVAASVIELAKSDAAALLDDDVVRFVASLDELSVMRLKASLKAAKVKAPPGWSTMIAGRVRDAAAKKAERRAGPQDFERGDHVELAQALVARLRGDAPLVADLNALHSYSADRGVWSPIEVATASRAVQSFAGSWVIGGDKPTALRIRATDVDGSIKLAQHQVARPRFFAEGPPGLAFRNGFVTLDGERVVVEDHHPEHAALFSYDFDYDHAAPCARWLGCLEAAFQGDADAGLKIQLLQEFGGAALLGMATKYQRCVMLTGDGANAKSTLAEIIEAAFPPGSTCAVAPQAWGDDRKLALMTGKIMNVVLELPEDDILTPEHFKGMVDGMMMTARQVYKDAYTWKPRMGHLFAANRLPGTTDHTHGFWRRWFVVEFNRIFREDEQNPYLKDEIVSSELQGIVAWLVEGARRLAARGRYQPPPSSAQAILRWRRAADPVAIFVSEKTRAAKTDVERMSASSIFQAYVSWAESNKYRVMSAGKFGQRMRGLGLKSEHTRTGEVYPVRLRREGEAAEDEPAADPEAELAAAAAREAALEAAAEQDWRAET